jgi:hypothetical protein
MNQMQAILIIFVLILLDFPNKYIIGPIATPKDGLIGIVDIQVNFDHF